MRKLSLTPQLTQSKNFEILSIRVNISSMHNVWVLDFSKNSVQSQLNN